MEEMTPNCELPNWPFGWPNCGWFSRLNISTRSSVSVLPIRVCLMTEASILNAPGPRRVLRPVLPYVAVTSAGAWKQEVLNHCAIVALLSAVNSNLLMAPRVVYAMSRDGLFWRGATEVNEGGTPDISLLFSSLLSAAFIMSGRFDQVIAILSFFFVANYTLSFMSLFVLRRREPDAPRPFRAIGHPFTTAIALLASIAFLIGAIASDTRNSLWALGVLAVSVPIYFLMKRKS